MKTMLVAVALSGALTIVSAMLASACVSGPPIDFRHEEEDPWVGKTAPEIHAQPVTGEGPRSLAEAKGRVVILDFWSTYCDPCRRSFPSYQALNDRFGDAVAVIAISMDSPEDQGIGKLEAFARETNVHFAILWDSDGSMKRLYRPPSLPTSFVIDAQGRIAHVHERYEAGDEDTIATEVEELLAPGTKRSP
jgi:peroxiredoxin